MNHNTELSELRLDKWLWAARFFKTRPLAAEAISGGKVDVNGQRAKPGRAIRIGTHLTLHKDNLVWEIVVVGLNTQRRPASEAVLLYQEDDASRLKRAELMRERRELGSNVSLKPNKRERRLIQQFTECAASKLD